MIQTIKELLKMEKELQAEKDFDLGKALREGREKFEADVATWKRAEDFLISEIDRAKGGEDAQETQS